MVLLVDGGVMFVSVVPVPVRARPRVPPPTVPRMIFIVNVDKFGVGLIVGNSRRIRVAPRNGGD